ncbi:PREDICTED: probable acetyltransferase NATA1-like [Nicotiana attenuata]|uniref:probable acetyltransferase NATA1-like n=1 Tax=Nicotiana attenuata TaxID=49451 RepID=UPI0009047244|nr:PREDICTED: probable acetyltransferase NATA1-like [Nicotiana attenuata]
MAKKISFNTQISGRVRLATESDVPHLHKLMYQMAKYHNYTKVFNATEASISTNLFMSNPCPPFYSVTAFILEVSPNNFPQKTTKNSIFDPIQKTINLDSPVVDPESELFRTNEDDIFIASYILFFPSYSAQAAKMGFSTVDWLTVGWNVDAIDFYVGMGAYIMDDVKRFRLSGEGLDAFASSEDADKFR